jgi:hypothetical protein
MAYHSMQWAEMTANLSKDSKAVLDAHTRKARIIEYWVAFFDLHFTEPESPYHKAIRESGRAGTIFSWLQEPGIFERFVNYIQPEEELGTHMQWWCDAFDEFCFRCTGARLDHSIKEE